jgi:hypothetical protein
VGGRVKRKREEVTTESEKKMGKGREKGKQRAEEERVRFNQSK